VRPTVRFKSRDFQGPSLCQLGCTRGLTIIGTGTRVKAQPSAKSILTPIVACFVFAGRPRERSLRSPCDHRNPGHDPQHSPAERQRPEGRIFLVLTGIRKSVRRGRSTEVRSLTRHPGPMIVGPQYELRTEPPSIALDMSPAYSEAVSTHLLKAEIVFDRSHVMKHFNEKLSPTSAKASAGKSWKRPLLPSCSITRVGRLSISG
jgi:hypothetical protein